LELGVGIDRPLLRVLGRHLPREGVTGNDRDAVVLLDLEAIVEAHGYALAREKRPFFAFFAAAGVGLTMPCASRLIAPANSEPASPSTAGLPRLTETGTARSDGISKATFMSRAPSTSFFDIPTFELARFRTNRIRVVGNERRSSVWRLRRTFFRVGTSRPHSMSSSSVRSSVASIGPWKKGDV